MKNAHILKSATRTIFCSSCAGKSPKTAPTNGDKHSTLHYFISLAMQYSMLCMGTGLMPSKAKAAKRDDIN